MNDEYFAKEPLFWLFWGKTKRKNPEEWHGLAWHCLEVGLTTQELWRSSISARRRAHLAQNIGIEETVLERWIGFLAAVHDYGKLSSLFQSLVDAQKWRIEDAVGRQLVFLDRQGGEPRHGLVSSVLLIPRFEEAFGMDTLVAERYALITGSHHGIFPVQSQLMAASERASIGDGVWEAARRQLFDWLRSAFKLPESLPQALLSTILSYFDAAFLTGLISIGDWLGSDNIATPFRTNAESIEQAVKSTQKRIECGLDQSGWLIPPVAIPATTFADAIRTLPPEAQPRTSQSFAASVISSMTGPGIAIVEFPTGSGKTEIALWAAAHWAERFGVDGFYIAMPTMATSDQLFDRVRKHLEKHLDGRNDPVNVQLVHGQASLSVANALQTDRNRSLADGIHRQTELSGSDEGFDTLIQTYTWFLPSKRGLLARYGVGTTDQTFLGILRTKHFFVRLFGMAGKTVVFDEVHGYDVYMSELFDEVLRWLGAFGAPVVILSATLPSHRVQAMLEAYAEGAGWSVESAPLAAYPRISVCDDRAIRSVAAPTERDLERTIALRWLPLPVTDESPTWQAIGTKLNDLLRDGGTAALICNTVRQAQSAFETLKEWFTPVDELTLFHARFRQLERADIQKNVLERFGKEVLDPESGCTRPKRHVVVATQVIEQSLDLDFDVLFTLFCPTDLLLQRAGRMQRHMQLDVCRLERFRGHPEVWVAGFDSGSDPPAFLRGSTAIYSRYVLLRSWAALRDLSEIQIPQDVSNLIEATYTPEYQPPDDLAHALAAARTAFVRQEQHDKERADRVKIPKLTDDEPDRGVDALLNTYAGLSELNDEPFLHASALAPTRLGPPTVQVVLLKPDEAAQWKSAIDPQRTFPLRTAEIQALLKFAVPLNDRRVVQAAREDEIPKIWSDSAYLKHCRLLRLDEKGAGVIGDVRLTLDPLLGVLIESDDAKGDEVP
jgi:CRISPR-associated endonuclease/helicase Cas3